MTDYRRRAAAELRQIRIDRRLSQRAVANRAGFSSVALSQWETGRVMPHPYNLQQWAAALGCEIALALIPLEDGP